MILKAGQDTAVVLEPGKQAFDLPAAAIATQGPPILSGRPGTIAYLNAKSGKASVQRLPVIGAVTGGGYTTIGTVIKTDLDLIAQTSPGGHIRFHKVTINEARLELIRLELGLFDQASLLRQ